MEFYFYCLLVMIIQTSSYTLKHKIVLILVKKLFFIMTDS